MVSYGFRQRQQLYVNLAFFSVAVLQVWKSKDIYVYVYKRYVYKNNVV